MDSKNTKFARTESVFTSEARRTKRFFELFSAASALCGEHSPSLYTSDRRIFERDDIHDVKVWEETDMEKIGFVGTGAMGSALLSRLKLANVVATAFDIAPKAMEAARAEGAQTAPSAKAVAQGSTIIDVVVRTDQEVLECMLGNNGVLEGAAPGSLVLLHSTIRPATTKKVAGACGR